MRKWNLLKGVISMADMEPFRSSENLSSDGYSDLFHKRKAREAESLRRQAAKRAPYVLRPTKTVPV